MGFYYQLSSKFEKLQDAPTVRTTFAKIALAIHNFESSFKEFPAAEQLLEGNFANNGWRGSSIFIQILPQIEQQTILDSINYDFQAGWAYLQLNATGLNITPPIYQCPSSAQQQFTWSRDYFGVQGSQNVEIVNFGNRGDVYNDGVFAFCKGRDMGEIRDGTSNTFCIGECDLPQIFGANGVNANATNVTGGPGPVPWWWGSATGGNTVEQARQNIANPARSVLTLTSPVNDPNFRPPNGTLGIDSSAFYHDIPFASSHPGGAMFGFADGHVDFVSNTVDLTNYREVGSCNSGNVVDLDFYLNDSSIDGSVYCPIHLLYQTCDTSTGKQ